MPELNSSIEIAAPVEAIFDFVDDWRNTMKYLHGLKKWEPLDPARTKGVGTRFKVVMGAGPVNVDGEMEIVQHERPNHVAFRSLKGIKASGTWTFTASGAVTRVDLRNSVEIPGGIAGRLIRKVVEAQGQRDLDASLADLKRLIELG